MLVSLVLAAWTSSLAQVATAPRLLPVEATPAYPKEASERAITGSVRFRATVDPEGRVVSVEIVSVPEKGVGFELATRDAVRQWRFEPARLDGRAVEGIYTGAVRFRLRPDDEDAIHELMHQAVEQWGTPESDVAGGGGAERPEPFLVKRLSESFPPGPFTSFSVDAIRFEGAYAWVRATLLYPTGRSRLFRTLMVRESAGWSAIVLEGGLLDRSLKFDTEPQAVFKPRSPEYPVEARERLIKGKVILQVLVEPDGSTTVLRVVSSLPYCTNVAIEHALRWRWTPARAKGVPVRALGIITVDFDIGDHDGREE